jgi:Tol biopolymer transport system component
MDIKGKNIQRVTNTPLEEFDPSLSPNKKQVAFSADAEESGRDPPRSEIYIVSSDGTNQKRVTDLEKRSQAFEHRPLWLSNTKIVYNSQIRQNKIKTLDLRTEKKKEVAKGWIYSINKRKIISYDLDLLLDKNQTVFKQDDESGKTLDDLKAREQSVFYRAHHTARYPEISPNQKMLAFTAGSRNSPEIVVMNRKTGEVIYQGEGSWTSWAPNSKKLLYTKRSPNANQRKGENIHLLDIRTGESEPLTSHLSGNQRDPYWRK